MRKPNCDCSSISICAIVGTWTSDSCAKLVRGNEVIIIKKDKNKSNKLNIIVI
jgi:hypothetical protein